MNQISRFEKRTIVLRKRVENESFGLYIGEDCAGGIYVNAIEAGSPAADADINAGDYILAVNGQLVSDMKANPKEIIAQLARTSRSLTLSIQSSMKNPSMTTKVLNTNDKYVSWPEQTNVIDKKVENYIKSLFGNENLQIVPSKSGNRNEYELIYDGNLPRPTNLDTRKYDASQTPQTFTDQRRNQNTQSSSQQRIVSSGIDISDIVLSNPVTSTKHNENIQPMTTVSFQNIETRMENQQPLSNKTIKGNRVGFHHDPSEPTDSDNDDEPIKTNKSGIREVHLYRSSHSKTFGFDVEYNQLYYLVTNIDLNSSATQSGLRLNDVILKIDNQPLDTMDQANLLHMMKFNEKITLQVQPLDDFLRRKFEMK